MARTSTNLYRAIIDGTFDTGTDPEADVPVEEILYPRIESDTHIDRSGREWTRRAEMTVFCHEGDSEVEMDGGTTLFDVEGWFGHVGWSYFPIPEGKILPENLRIRRSRSDTTNRTGSTRGRRHEIVPLTRMPLQTYRGALDNLARNAIVRQIELAR